MWVFGHIWTRKQPSIVKVHIFAVSELKRLENGKKCNSSSEMSENTKKCRKWWKWFFWVGKARECYKWSFFHTLSSKIPKMVVNDELRLVIIEKCVLVTRKLVKSRKCRKWPELYSLSLQVLEMFENASSDIPSLGHVFRGNEKLPIF